MWLWNPRLSNVILGMMIGVVMVIVWRVIGG